MSVDFQEWNNEGEELLTELLPQSDDDDLDRGTLGRHVKSVSRNVVCN